MNSLSPSLYSVSADLAWLLPKILIGFLLFVVGLILAKIVKRLVIKTIRMLMGSSIVTNTPIEHFFSNGDLSHRIDEGFGTIAYWFVLLITGYVVSATVGLTSVSYLLEQVFRYIPRFISAMVVLIIGVLLAGLVESFSKSSLGKIDHKTAKIVSKLSSYIVMILTLMVAFSELGIARDFILILFIGLVLALALGVGLAFGLGGQHVVKHLTESWLSEARKDGSTQEKK